MRWNKIIVILFDIWVFCFKVAPCTKNYYDDFVVNACISLRTTTSQRSSKMTSDFSHAQCQPSIPPEVPKCTPECNAAVRATPVFISLTKFSTQNKTSLTTILFLEVMNNSSISLCFVWHFLQRSCMNQFCML